MNHILDILLAVGAEVIAHYICKWLDRREKDDSKPVR